MLRLLFGMLSVTYLSASFACADLFVPGTNEPPVGQPGFGWSRSDANAFYSGWDVFTDDSAAAGIQDSTPQFGTGGASLSETTGTGFLTSGGNIYSFAAPTVFTVSIPSAGLGPAGFTTRVVAQFRTLGSELNYSSILLNGIAAQSTFESARVNLGGFGGAQVDYLAAWDLSSITGPLTLTFSAASSSMSLDHVHIDGHSSVTAVPEPASMGLVAAAAGCVGFRKWRKRKADKVSA